MSYKPPRLPELDGLRGCAILMVLLWHYVPCELLPPAPGSAAPLIARCLALTWSGVDLFFVLSGFLITGILLDNRQATNLFRVFYARRSCRILPVYLLLFATYVVCFAGHHGARPRFHWLTQNPLPLWSYATFTQNFFMARQGNFGPCALAITWSLAVEEQFYCFIPLLVWLVPRRVFVVIATFLVFAAPILRGSCGGLWSYVLTPWRGDSLLAGALIAVAVRDQGIVRWLRSSIPILYAVCGGLLGGAVVIAIRSEAFGVLNFTWLAAFYSAILLLAVVERETIVARILRNQMLRRFGVLSYGLYMFHQFVSGLVHGLLGDGVPLVTSLRGCGLTLLSFAITFVVAAISYRFYERPILDWGQRFGYREAAATGSRSDEVRSAA